MVSMFQGWRFQHWKQASLWIAKKIRRQRIRGITRRRSKSNARGACRIIEDNSTSHFCTIESHENDSKTRKLGALWTETERRWKAIFHLRTAVQRQQEKIFCIGLWLEMRSGYSTPTPRRKNTTLSPVNRCHRSQHQYHGRTFVVRRSCSVSDGTKRVLFTMSYWNLAIPLRAIGIGYNWFIWAVHCEKDGRNTSKDMIKLFFFMTTLGLMSLKSKKNICKRSNGTFYRTRRILWTLFLLITDCSEGCTSPIWQVTSSLLSQKSKISFKRRIIFSKWNSKIAWEMGKSSRQRWTIL